MSDRRGFWDAFGLDEGGLPEHLPMEVTKDDQGPADAEDMHHMACWCGNPGCMLTKALHMAWLMGQASTLHLVEEEWKPGVAEALREAAGSMVPDSQAQRFVLVHAQRLDP